VKQRANRAFLSRTVRYLAADAGVRLFLDADIGLPSANNMHEVVQAVVPEAPDRVRRLWSQLTCALN
jgi:hypothetical protein